MEQSPQHRYVTRRFGLRDVDSVAQPPYPLKAIALKCMFMLVFESLLNQHHQVIVTQTGSIRVRSKEGTVVCSEIR
jgi:hypothetical protein